MSSPITGQAPLRSHLSSDRPFSAVALILCVTLGTVVLHWFAATWYGFHRDELATLDDARHLAWGFVAYPPVTPFFGRLSLILFGTSVAGFRLFASVASAVAMVVTGLMARELGGGRTSQFIALAAALPACLGVGALMQYVAFDYLWWVLAAYFIMRVLRTEEPRWWLAIGASVGLGFMTKYSMAFLVAAILVGLVLTPARRYLKSKWFWYAVALAVLICLPNIAWQARNHFISLDFLKHIHERDVRIGRTKDFLPDQLKLTLLALPLCVAGLYWYLLAREGKTFRVLGWMYLTVLALFILAKGRGYYLLPGYPMLYAAGAVWVERRVDKLHRGWAAAWIAVLAVALTADVVLVGAITLPMTPVGSKWWNFASAQNGDLVEEIGWPELGQEVARIRDSLPAGTRLGILAANYGEAGAINLYGPRYSLPEAISGVNSFWTRGYPDPPPDTVIVLGHSRRFLDANFERCELAGHASNPFGVMNEESRDHPDIYLCHNLKHGWPEFWKRYRHYG